MHSFREIYSVADWWIFSSTVEYTVNVVAKFCNFTSSVSITKLLRQ